MEEGETLYETWECYRELQRRCPHHGLPDWLIVQTFYNGLTYPTMMHVDAAVGGALMRKSAEETQQLIEKMAPNNYQWANERVQRWKNQGNQQRPVNPPDFQPKQPFPESKVAWELAIEKLANVSNDKIEKLASATTQRFERIEGRMDQLTNMYRNVEVQLRQITNAVNNRNQGDLPSKTEVNPREHMKAITLQSGKEVGEPPVIESEREYERRENKQLSELGEDNKKIKGKEKVEECEPQIDETTPIPPPVPFSQKLKPSRNDKEIEKFVNIFKQLHINIPFVDAILQIPSYAKFLNEIMTKKRKLVDSVTIALMEECNAIIQNKLSPKLKDLGSFTVPYTIGTIIDVKCDKFKFQIGEEKVEFDLSKVEKYSYFTDHVYYVNICDELTLEMSQVNLDDDSLELCFNGVGLQQKQV
ncbi:uncharacterized protein [Coffea arabica]|uniref:Uncharacterized protein n=1 Tax=Coffea arabica TaxID=13443 RepID=A0ABM4UHR9_COFAR